MHIEIRQNIPAYLADLKKWLTETQDVPLEAMGDFFTARVSTYEVHMARWDEAYQAMAKRIPEIAAPCSISAVAQGWSWMTF